MEKSRPIVITVGNSTAAHSYGANNIHLFCNSNIAKKRKPRNLKRTAKGHRIFVLCENIRDLLALDNAGNAMTKHITRYGNICQCDDGFMCEHRTEWLIRYLKRKMKSI